MSSFFIFNNIHLGIELLGAIIFFVAAWLFFEAYLIKKDGFSIGRSLGFGLLSVSQVIQAIHSTDDNISAFSVYIYLVSLVLILLSYALEKLPPRPEALAIAFVSINSIFIKNYSVLASVLLIIITAVLAKRYFRDIEKLLKWLIAGFFLLSASSIISIFARSEINSLWVLGQAIKLLAFVSIVLWVWQWLSLRIKEETLLVFISSALFVALFITTAFSAFFFNNIQKVTENNLSLSAKVSDFYISSLKDKALASAGGLVQNPDFIGALRTKDGVTLEKFAKSFLESTGEKVFVVADIRGNVFFKFNYPVKSGENVLSEKIGAEAIEGRRVATIGFADEEGLSVRAAVPVLDRGKIVGVFISGFLLDKQFVENLKRISNLEATVFSGDKVIASSILAPETRFNIPQSEFVGTVNLLNNEVVGAFLPLKSFEGSIVGMLSMTTTPGELARQTGETNRLIILMVFVIALVLVVPLYRFTVYLTS